MIIFDFIAAIKTEKSFKKLPIDKRKDKWNSDLPPSKVSNNFYFEKLTCIDPIC